MNEKELPTPAGATRKVHVKQWSRSPSWAANGSRDDSEVDDGCVAASQAPEPPPASALPAAPRRVRRHLVQLPAVETMTEALTACIRRSCGLQSSTRVRSGAARVLASVVGDPVSASRAIVLRHGAAKRDAIMWVSAAGGLMCSCFGGTQNAQLLSVCGRSTDCQHVALLKRYLVLSGVSLSKFQRRMQLQAGAADFGHITLWGSTVVWTVLYQAVFTLVTFSPEGVAACIGSGCRRFRGRCGHVRVARPLHAAHEVEAAADLHAAAHDLPSGSKPAKPLSDYASCVVSAKEDQGVEKLPTNTLRGKGDA